MWQYVRYPNIQMYLPAITLVYHMYAYETNMKTVRKWIDLIRELYESMSSQSVRNDVFHGNAICSAAQDRHQPVATNVPKQVVDLKTIVFWRM